MHPTIGYQLSQDHLADLRHQARRHALARAGRPHGGGTHPNRGKGTTTMLTNSRSRLRRLTALGGAALVTAVVIAASAQAGVGGAEASVTGAQPVTSPYSLSHPHPYLRAAGLTDVVTVTNPGPQSGYKGHPESLQIKATSSFGLPLKYQATGLPGGLAISPSGLISGTPRYGADPPIVSTVTVTATDTLGKHGAATFTWSIDWIQHCTPTTCT